jgi:tRNA(fMet)-specific endonuclease VapC
MLLDTNAYSALALGVQSVSEAVDGYSELKLPLPVIAELRYGFAKGSKQEHNEQVLQRFLAQEQVSILMPTLNTTKYYADIQLFCIQKGRALSHNDIWIAALAREHNDTLITFDHDFEVLLEDFGDKLIILDK